MIKFIVFIIFGIILCEKVYSEESKLFYIDNSDPIIKEIKKFVSEESNFYPNHQIFKISDKIHLDLDDLPSDLEVYFFKIDKEFIIPFIAKNFNRFVHKDLLLNITKLVYDNLVYNVEFFPINENTEKNVALCSYPNEKEILIILPLFKANLRWP